jgi:hypothetical protein
MSDLRSDISSLGRIYLITRNFEQWKSRSEAKVMRLGPDKLAISKLDNIEIRKIMGATRSNLNSMNQT